MTHHPAARPSSKPTRPLLPSQRTNPFMRRPRFAVPLAVAALAATALLTTACEPEVPPPEPVALATTGFVGPVATIVGNSGNYVFAGPAASIEVTAQAPRVTGAATAPMGLADGGSPQLADVGMCFRPAAGGALTNFVGSNFSQSYFTTQRATYAASATAVLAPGDYLAGMCVRNNGSTNIKNNNFVNGWVQVTS